MQIHGPRLRQTPQRLSPGQAKLIGGLGIGMLLLSASGLFLYEGWPRVIHVSALALLGLANVLLAGGSVLSEDRGSTVLRQVLPPLVLLMFVALMASTAMYWLSDGSAAIRGIVIGGIAGGVVPWVLRWTRR
jgi:cytochrome c oxidase subunit IV